MPGETVALRKDQPIELVTPGVDIGYGVQIDERRSISCKTTFPQDMPFPQQEQMLTGVIALIAIATLREKLIEFKKDREIAELRLAQKPAEFAVARKKLTEERDALFSEAGEFRRQAEDKFKASGREGAFKPQGAEKGRIDGFVKDMDAKRQALANLDLDEKRQLDECREAIGKWNRAIEVAEAEIKVRREAYGV